MENTNDIIVIAREEYDEYIEAMTRLQIVKRLVKDADNYLDTGLLRKVLGMLDPVKEDE